MRFRLGLLIGIALGYVLGARAGRARYEQIANAIRGFMGSESAQQITDQVKAAATIAGETFEERATQSVAKVTEMVRGESAEGGRRY